GRPLPILVAVCGADQESRLGFSVVAPSLESGGKLDGGYRRAPFIQDNGDAVFRDGRNASAFVRQLGDFCGPGNSLEIAVDQPGLRRAADLSASNDVKKHSPVA